jgi:uncharacterized protein YndB with AHSA1/START domain
MIVMNTTQQSASPAADREIVLTRVLDAPREQVFDAWTDPVEVAKWWGPNGFTSTIRKMDVRPGGVWQLIMHGPDGTDYHNRSIYVEVVRPSRLVFDHASGPKFRMTVTFEDLGGKTLLTMQHLFPTAAERDQCVQAFGAVEGGKQTLARLAAFLSNK